MEPNMPRSATAEITVNVPPAAAWERLRDLGKAHYYVPNATDTRIDTPQTSGAGTSRTVFMKGQAPLQETVIEWNEGSSFTLNLHRGAKALAPFKRAEFVYSMAPAGEQTRFKFELCYTPANWLVSLVDRLFIHKLMLKNVRSVAKNLKKYYETGTASNPGFGGDR